MLNNKNTFQEAAWEPTPRPNTSGTQLLETLRVKSEAKLGTKGNSIMSALQSRAKQKWYSKAPQDHFDADSVAALGIGNVDYNTLRQMAYDGRITITDPGEWQKLTVSWADGWGPNGYRQTAADLATPMRSRVSAAGSAGDVQRAELHGGQQEYGFLYPEEKKIDYPGYRITPGSEEQKALIDSILAAKMGDTERVAELEKFWENEDALRAAGVYAKYLSDPEFAKYAAQGAAIENPDYMDANLRGAGSTGGGNRAQIGNIVTFSRENRNILENSGDDFRNAGVDNKNGSSLFLYMTDTEVDLYNYLLAKEGEDTAMEYLHQIENALKARRGQARAEDIADQRGGAWGDIDYILNSGGLAFASGVDRTLKGFEQYGTEEKIDPSTLSYADYFFSKDLKNPIDKTVYGIVNQVGGMAPMLLTTIAAQAIGVPAPVTAALGATMVGIPAAGNAYTEALERGHSKLSARIYAECVGISEAGLQYVLGGISKAGGIAADSLLTKVAAWDKAIFRFAGTVAVKGGAEALEENLQNFLEPLFASVILGEEYDLPTWEEIIYTTLISAATGIVMDADTIVDATIHGDGTNKAGQKNVTAKEFVQEKLQAAIQKVTGKKVAQNTAQKTAQNAAESVSAAGSEQAQGKGVSPVTQAEAGGIDVNTPTKKETSIQDEVIQALVDHAQKMDAKTDSAAELERQQQIVLERLFESDKKAESKADTATEAQNMSAAQEVTAAPKVDTPEKNVPQVEAEIQEVKAPGFYSNDLFTGTKSEQQYLDNLAKAVGVSMEMTQQDTGDNGWIVNGKVYISSSAEDPVRVVAKHEITHRIQEAAGDAYTMYRNFVEQILRERGGLDDKIRAIQELYASRGQTLSREQALDELAADFAGELLENEALIRKIANEDRNLAQRILDGIRDLIRRIKSAFGDTETKKLGRAAQLWEQALQESNRAYKRSEIEERNGVRYSIGRLVGKKQQYGEGVILDTDLFDNVKPRDWGNVLGQYVYKNMAGAELTMYDDSGISETVYLARENDRAKKDGAKRPHKVLDKLAGYRGNGIRALAIVHLSEVLEVSKQKETTSDHSHQWLDENGWIIRTAYLQDKSGNIYEATLNIADGRDRKILYEVNQVHRIDETKNLGEHTDTDANQRSRYQEHKPGSTQSEATDTTNTVSVNTVPQGQKSVKGSRELQRRIDALERQNKRLKEQLKRTDIPKVRRDVVKRSAKDLRTMYSSGIDADTLTGRIEDLYNKIAKYSGAGTLQDIKGVPSWKEIEADASSIAYAILSESRSNVNSAAEEYAGFIKELRGRKISISPDYRADLESAGGYEGIRKQNFGTFTLSKDGTPIGVVYMELSEQHPELFPDDIFHPADQLIRLSDVVEELKPVMGNPFEQDLDHTAKYLAGEIIERFYDTPNEKPTKADRMAETYYRQRIRDRKEMRAALENQRKAYIDQAEEIKRKFESENQERIERQNAAQRRETIYRHAFRLGKKLLRPTNKQHVPEELRGVAFELVKYINLESGFEYDFTKDAMYQRVAPGSVPFPVKTSRTLAALNLKKQLEEAAGNEAISIDPEMNDYLQELAEMGNKTLADMSKAELDTVWKVLQIVEHTISKANELHEQGRYKNVQEMADAVERSADRSSSRKSFVGPVGALDKLVNFDMLTPETFLHKLGEAGDELFRMMRRSEDRQIEIIKNGVEAAQKLVQESGVNFKKLDKELHTFKLAKGELTLSTSQIMELYALMNRKQAVDHILKGGLKSIGTVKGVVELRNAQPIHVNSLDVAEIIGVLTDKQKTLMDGLQKYLSTTLADYGNAETMKVYGYKKFKEPHYWPIKVAGTEVGSDPASKVREKMIPSYGMTKLTQPKAKNPVELRSAMDSFSAHLNQMSTYAAWLGTNEDINRLINFKYMDDDLEVRDTVKRLLESVYGKNGEAYLNNLLGDIAQGTKAGEDKAITETLTGNWKAAKVGANLRVVVQQPTSILRALDMLDPKYFVAGGSIKKGWEKAKKYSQIAQWKDWGYFEINTGRSLRELVVGTESTIGKIRNAMMWAAGAADSATWGYLWNAVENETADLHPELAKGSEAFYKATAERFGQIIDRTQVVDSVLHRTQIMRSSKARHKEATNFMGEPSKIYNMVARSIVDLSNAKTDAEKKAAIKSTARTVAALTASFALNALVQSVIDGLRDDDRDKGYWEKFAENYFGITGEEDSAAEVWQNFWSANLWQNFNPFGYLPYVKDVMSLIQGYSVDRSDMASVTEIINAMRQFAKSIAGDGQKTVWATGFEALAKVADLLGIPVSNIKRDAVAILNTILNELDLFELQYELDKIVYSEENASGVFFGDIYRAMNEDVDAYVDIYEDYYEGLIDRGMTEDEAVDKVRDAMEKKMKDEIGVKSVKSLPVRWEPPAGFDTDDEQAKIFLQMLFDGENSGGWVSQLPEDAVELSKKVDELRGGSNWDRVVIIAKSDSDEWLKELLISNNLKDASYERYMAARNANVSTKDYVAVLEKANAIAKARGAKSASQADIREALEKSSLSKEKKRAIWNAFVDTGAWKTDSPW